jgi:hypothetical protein
MKTEVIVCDLCKEKIAKQKCEICDEDCCEDCSHTWNYDVWDVPINNILTCVRCSEQINNMRRTANKESKRLEKLDTDNSTKKLIIDTLKQRLILFNLNKEIITREKDEDDEDDEDEDYDGEDSDDDY